MLAVALKYKKELIIMIDTNDIEIWFQAIELADINQVSTLLANNPQLLEAKLDEQPALVFATYKNHLNVVEFLLGNGANIETVNNLGHTALMEASINGRYAIAKLLVHRGANTQAISNYGETALDNAIFFENLGCTNVVKLLIKSGATHTRKKEVWSKPILLQQAFDEARSEGDTKAIINIFKYNLYIRSIKLDDPNSQNTQNLINFILTHKEKEDFAEIITKENHELLSHLPLTFEAINLRKISIILNDQITDDKDISLAIKTLNGGEKYINKAKQVFQNTMLLSYIIKFIGFTPLPKDDELAGILQNIKWSASDILFHPSLEKFKTKEIIEDQRTLIDTIGVKFYTETQDYELDISLLRTDIPATESFIDSYGFIDPRKFKEFMVLKGIANQLNLRIEFYSKKYGLASFGKNTEDYKAKINIYKMENDQYTMTSFQENPSIMEIDTDFGATQTESGIKLLELTSPNSIIKKMLNTGNGLIQEFHGSNKMILFVPEIDFKFPSISFNFVDMFSPLQYLNAILDVGKKTILADKDQKVQTIAKYAYFAYLSKNINSYNSYLSWERLFENIENGDYKAAIIPSLQLTVANQITGLVDAYLGDGVFGVTVLGLSALNKINELLPLTIDLWHNTFAGEVLELALEST